MIEVDGYKAFKGVMRINPKSTMFSPYEEYGEWLYRPDIDCWSNGKSSYPASICEVIKEEK